MLGSEVVQGRRRRSKMEVCKFLDGVSNK